MSFLLILLVVASALGQPLQIAANSRLREAVQSPALSALIAFVVGSVLLAILVVSGLFERGRLSGAHQSPLVGLDGRRAGRLLDPGRDRRPSKHELRDDHWRRDLRAAHCLDGDRSLRLVQRPGRTDQHVAHHRRRTAALRRHPHAADLTALFVMQWSIVAT
jgi:hypothetical protein